MQEKPLLSAADLATVLVVEDERELCELFAEWLGDRYAVRTAYDGDSALELLDDDVDAILLDRRMPGRSGDEVLAEVRDRGYDCTVIMATAIDPDLNILEMDFDDYLCKPIDRRTLLEIFEQHLRPEPQEMSMLNEFFRDVSKIVVLEDSLSSPELEQNPQYHQLKQRINTLGAELSERVEDFDTLVATYREINRS